MSLQVSTINRNVASNVELPLYAKQMLKQGHSQLQQQQQLVYLSQGMGPRTAMSDLNLVKSPTQNLASHSLKEFKKRIRVIVHIQFKTKHRKSRKQRDSNREQSISPIIVSLPSMKHGCASQTEVSVGCLAAKVESAVKALLADTDSNLFVQQFSKGILSNQSKSNRNSSLNYFSSSHFEPTFDSVNPSNRNNNNNNNNAPHPLSSSSASSISVTSISFPSKHYDEKAHYSFVKVDQQNLNSIFEICDQDHIKVTLRLAQHSTTIPALLPAVHKRIEEATTITTTTTTTTQENEDIIEEREQSGINSCSGEKQDIIDQISFLSNDSREKIKEQHQSIIETTSNRNINPLLFSTDVSIIHSASSDSAVSQQLHDSPSTAATTNQSDSGFEPKLQKRVKKSQQLNNNNNNKNNTSIAATTSLGSFSELASSSNEVLNYDVFTADLASKKPFESSLLIHHFNSVDDVEFIGSDSELISNLLEDISTKSIESCRRSVSTEDLLQQSEKQNNHCVESEFIKIKQKSLWKLYKSKMQIRKEKLEKLEKLPKHFETLPEFQSIYNLKELQLKPHLQQHEQPEELPIQTESTNQLISNNDYISPKHRLQLRVNNYLRFLDEQSFERIATKYPNQRVWNQKEEFSHLGQLLFVYQKSQPFTSKPFAKVLEEITQQMNNRFILSVEEVKSLIDDLIVLFPQWITLSPSKFGSLIQLSNSFKFRNFAEYFANL